MYTITKQFEFEAAHALTKVPGGHKCKRLHGHNYVVTIELKSQKLDEFDFVVDFGELNRFKTYIDRELDHRNLNDCIPMETTAENLARHFYLYCVRIWPQTSAAIVAETRGTTARYEP